MRALSRNDLRRLRQPQLPEELYAPGAKPPPPVCPVATPQLDCLWEHFRRDIQDHRDPQGLRHPLPAILAIIALGVCAGCHGPEAIGEFATSLNHHQRRRLRCRPRPGRPGQYEVPSIDAFRRALRGVDSVSLAKSVIGWRRTQDPEPLMWIHFDGKVLKWAEPAPAADPKIVETHSPAEIDPAQQKPKAQQLLPGDVPPSAGVDGEGAREGDQLPGVASID